MASETDKIKMWILGRRYGLHRAEEFKNRIFGWIYHRINGIRNGWEGYTTETSGFSSTPHFYD